MAPRGNEENPYASPAEDGRPTPPWRMLRTARKLFALLPLWVAMWMFSAFDSLRAHSVFQSNPQAFPPASLLERIWGFSVCLLLAIPAIWIIWRRYGKKTKA